MGYSAEVKRRWRDEGRCSNCGSRDVPDQPRRTWKLCERCLVSQRGNSLRYARKLRRAAFDAYGGPVCACCGEDQELFLTIDHVNGDGAAHRRELGKRVIYGWLKEHGYPEGFRVLCQNCNAGRWRNGGVCPHEEVMP